jgi:hypothetical protein
MIQGKADLLAEPWGSPTCAAFALGGVGAHCIRADQIPPQAGWIIGLERSHKIQGETGLRAEPRGPRHALLLRLAGWESAAPRLTNPTTSEMPKRFGARRPMIQGETGLRAEPRCIRADQIPPKQDALAVWSEATK